MPIRKGQNRKNTRIRVHIKSTVKNGSKEVDKFAHCHVIHTTANGEDFQL